MGIVDTSLYKELIRRSDEAAQYYHSFLDICKDDLAMYLENVRSLFPEYPGNRSYLP